LILLFLTICASRGYESFVGAGFRTLNEIWILRESGIGSLLGTTVNIIWSGNTDSIAYTARYLENVDQITPILNSGSNTDNPVSSLNLVATEGAQTASYVSASHGRGGITAFNLTPVDLLSPSPFFMNGDVAVAGTTTYNITSNNSQRIIAHYLNMKTSE